MIMLGFTMAYVSMDLSFLFKEGTENQDYLSAMQYLMVVAMFFRWFDILKYLRFNTKFANLLQLVTSILDYIK